MKKKYQIFCATLGLSLIATTSFAHSFVATKLSDQSNYTLTNLGVPTDKSSNKRKIFLTSYLLDKDNMITQCHYDIVFYKKISKIAAPYIISVEKESGNPQNCRNFKFNVKKSSSNPKATTITYTSASQEFSTVDLALSNSAGKIDRKVFASITFYPNKQNRVITLQQLSNDTFALQSSQVKDVTGANCTVYSPRGERKQISTNVPATLLCGHQNA